ncbi:hypothetical protein Vadar_018448 [Vaccinium darrowii]|uniref:Uncharacterized protein n=1 Tax=Vaccinium darrowii TaxID=229202 RepID=A0ACB7XAV2_9ERIC|nr:hypothetical protein Vadar_018448 [Vaccinium darrowii]
MLTAKYDKKFTELSKYAPHLVATDALRAQRFVDGLNDKYRLQVKLSGKRTYTDVLNVALMVEEDQAKVRGSDGGQQTKRINYMPPKDQRGASSFKKRNTNTSGWSQGGSSSSGSGSQLCPKCGRMHRGQCYRDMRACFKCGTVGHMMKNCPTWAKQSVATPAATTSSGQSTGTKPNAGKKQARAFALIPGDPENANSVVSEHCTEVFLKMGDGRITLNTNFGGKFVNDPSKSYIDGQLAYSRMFPDLSYTELCYVTHPHEDDSDDEQIGCSDQPCVTDNDNDSYSDSNSDFVCSGLVDSSSSEGDSGEYVDEVESRGSEGVNGGGPSLKVVEKDMRKSVIVGHHDEGEGATDSSEEELIGDDSLEDEKGKRKGKG